MGNSINVIFIHVHKVLMFELQLDTLILFLEGENILMSPLSIICDKRNNVLSQFWSYNHLKCVKCVLEAGSLNWIDRREKKNIPETIKPDYVFDFIFELRSVNPSAASVHVWVRMVSLHYNKHWYPIWAGTICRRTFKWGPHCGCLLRIIKIYSS